MKTYAYLITLSLLLSVHALAQDASVGPEKTTTVLVSSRDVNRVHCPSTISNVEYSKEKQGVVKVADNNLFVKFLVKVENGMSSFSSMPFDLHVTCGGEVYTLILQPRDQVSTTVRLQNPTRNVLQGVAKEWGALPLEEKVQKLTQSVYRNEIPSSFGRAIINGDDPRFNVRLFKDVEVIGKQEVNARGTGLRAVEYALIAHKPVTFDERDFLIREMGDVVGITIQPLTVDKEGVARLIIIQRSVDNGT